MAIEHVGVVGLGKVGELVATLLKDAGFAVTGYDQAERSDLAFPVERLDATSPESLRTKLGAVDAVVSCLPFHLTARVAEVAAELETHYFDLTEDVRTTERIQELAAGTDGVVFAPQCGLAPGLVGIIGASLMEGLDTMRSVQLRVGALPKYPTGQLGYAFNWSGDGVVNEYLNDCEVLRDGSPRRVAALTEDERVLIGGVELTASLTSGGLGTMCDTYSGRIQRLDYKTLRYPGHFEAIRFCFDELGLRQRRALVSELLQDAKPPVAEDIVYLYASVEGHSSDAERPTTVRREYVRAYGPLNINGRVWRAISWTTAAAVAAVVELVARGDLIDGGFLRQEEIPFDALLKTHNGERFAVLGAV